MGTPILLTSHPISIFLVRHSSESRKQQEVDLATELMLQSKTCLFRGVEINHLDDVLRYGIDVSPTDSVIYADFPDKALEYGGWPKLLMAFNAEHLRWTFIEIAANSSEELKAQVFKEFPTMLPSSDGSRLWCTRLGTGDPRIASAYERSYAWWIPGDPWRALKALFILVRPEDCCPTLCVDLARKLHVMPEHVANAIGAPTTHG